MAEEEKGQSEEPKILQEMEKRLQNLEQGQSEMRETLQRLEEHSAKLKEKDKSRQRKTAYEWVDDEEGKKLIDLEFYFRGCIDSGLDAFHSKYQWLLPLLSPDKEGNCYSDFYGSLYWLGVMNAQFYLGKKSREDLEPLYKYNEWGANVDNEVLQKIVKEQGLNSEQAGELRGLAHKKAVSQHYCFRDKEKIKWFLYQDGRVDKAFWMKAELNNFIKVMKEGMEQHIEKSEPYFRDIPEAFMKSDGAKKYQGNEGKERFARDIVEQMFAEFEKDLRDVQWKVLKYWERSKYWWEKPWVVVPLAVGGGLSVFASNIAICKWLGWFQWFGGCEVNEWGVWFLPGVALLAAGYFVYNKIYKRIKSRRP